MEDKVLLALIASATALIVSLINLLSMLVTSRRSHRQSVVLERVKTQISLLNEETNRSITALNDGIAAIQKLKDAIWIAAHATPSSIEHEELMDTMEAGIRGMVASFESADPYLTAVQRKPFHAAKNMSLRLRECVQVIDDISIMSEETRNTTLEIRRHLTDFQTELRGIKVETLIGLRGTE